MTGLARGSHGFVYWITGFSGAGKTTVANSLCRLFEDHDVRPIMLDGDALRAAIGPDVGHDPKDRKTLAMAYGGLCKLLSLQGFPVICATISMFQDVRDWNRREIPGYREIYIRAPIELRRARDPKGLYSKDIEAMRSYEAIADVPRSPDLELDAEDGLSPDELAKRIWQKLIVPDIND